MTKAEARRLLNCSTDRELAFRLGIAYTTVWRWGRMVPKKYWDLVKLKEGYGELDT